MNLPSEGIWVAANEFYSAPPFIGGVVLCLAVWTYLAGRPVAAAGHAVRKALDGIRETLVRAGEAAEVARDYPSLDERFRSDPAVGDEWAAMDRTLLRPGPSGGAYRQTVPATEFFGLQLLGLAGADLRAARAHANALVGVGLVLTFLGLVLALKAAGGSLGAAEPGQVQIGLGMLLGTAASKFAFSVTALLLSLLFASWLRQETRRTERSVSAFLAALDRRLPPLTPQEVASETQALLRGDSAARRDETDRLAAAVAARFDEALHRRLGEAVQPLAVAISRMTSSLSESNRRALEEMADRFHERLEGAAGVQIREATVAMERVGGHVRALAETLAEVRDGLAGAGADAARDLTQAASDAARRIADAAESTRMALAAAGPEWERSSARAATLLRDGLLEGTSALRAGIELGGEGLNEALGRAGGRLEEGGRRLEERLARAATDAGREIRGAGVAIGAAGTAAGSALTAAGEASSRHLSEAAGAIAGAATDAAREIRGASVAVGAAGTAAGSALTAAGEASSRHLSEVAGAIAGAAELLNASVGAAEDSSGTLARALHEGRLATGDAASLFARAAALLDAAAGRMADAPTTWDVVDELRAVAGRLTVIGAGPAGDALPDAAGAPAEAGAPSGTGHLVGGG